MFHLKTDDRRYTRVIPLYYNGVPVVSGLVFDSARFTSVLGHVRLGQDRDRFGVSLWPISSHLQAWKPICRKLATLDGCAAGCIP